jgi:hypothetical protein
MDPESTDRNTCFTFWSSWNTAINELNFQHFAQKDRVVDQNLMTLEQCSNYAELGYAEPLRI